MQRSYLVIKSSKVLILIMVFCFLNCSEIPCLENDKLLKVVKIENGGHIWNCGSKFWEADNNELSEICKLLNNSKEINQTSVRLSNWRLDIYFNGEEEKRFAEHLSLYNTESSGFIFRKFDNCYSNNELAEYLIKKVGITNSNSSPCNN